MDLDSGYSMLQHGTKLFLVQHDKLCEELFYQLGLRQFGALGKIKLNPPPSLKELLEIGMENEPEAETLPVDQIVQVGLSETAYPVSCHSMSSDPG